MVWLSTSYWVGAVPKVQGLGLKFCGDVSSTLSLECFWVASVLCQGSCEVIFGGTREQPKLWW